MSLHEQWITEGYVIARNLLTPVDASRLLEICDHARQHWSVRDESLGRCIDNDDCVDMRHVNHPAYFRDRPELLATLLETCADPRVLGVLRAVWGEEPAFYCTTYWFNPRRSRDGNWHRDTQFVTKNDDEEKAMLFGQPEMGVQLQVALIASDDMEVVPRSHLRWDTEVEYRIRKSDGCAHARSHEMPGALRVALQPGDAVAFNPCALHRGRYHADKPRRTLMLTYQRESVQPQDNYFTRQPWVLETPYLTGLSAPAQEFFERFIRRNRSFWDSPVRA